MTEHYINPPKRSPDKPTIYNEDLRAYINEDGSARVAFAFNAHAGADDILRILVCSQCMKVGLRSIHNLDQYHFPGWQTKYPVLCEECNNE